MPSPATDEYRSVPWRWFKAPVEQAVSFGCDKQGSGLQKLNSITQNKNKIHTKSNNNNADQVGREPKPLKFWSTRYNESGEEKYPMEITHSMNKLVAFQI